MPGIGAYIAGGALQGLGAGMMQRQKVSDEERRDAALRAARKEEIETQYRMAGENDAASDQRSRDTQVQLQGNQQRFAAAQGSAAAAAAKDARASEQQHEIDMQTLKGRQALDQTVAEINARAKADGDMIDRTEVDELTGAIIGIRKNGSASILPGVVARKLPKATSESALGLGAGTVTPVTQKQAALPPLNSDRYRN